MAATAAYGSTLNERRYGILEGRLQKAAERRYGAERIRRWRLSWSEGPPGGESLSDVSGRAVPFLDEQVMADLAAGRNVLIARQLVRRVADAAVEAADEEHSRRDACPGEHAGIVARARGKLDRRRRHALDLLTEDAPDRRVELHWRQVDPLLQPELLEQLQEPHLVGRARIDRDARRAGRRCAGRC